jgi:hypothetical protein
MKNLFQAAEQSEKLAADQTARLRKLAANVVAASARDQINKLATTMGDTAVRNEQQGVDKVQETLQNAMANLSMNEEKPGKLYTSGIGQTVPAPAAQDKMAGENIQVAVGLRVLNHVKIATGISDAMTKVACPVHSGDACGFCGGGGEVVKAASDQAALHIDAVSEIAASEAIGKFAADAVGDASTEEVSALAPQAMGAMSQIDEQAMSMKPADPPPIDFGALSVSKNPMVRFIGDNLDG